MKNIANVDDLFTKDDRLNSSIIRQEWFKTAEIYKSIIKASEKFNKEFKFLEQIHIYKFNLTDLPKCKVCAEDAHFNPYGGKYGIYSATCKNRSCISISIKDKRNSTCMQRYGALVSNKHISKNANAIKNFIDKGKQTLLEKYGVSNPSNIPGNCVKKQQTLLDNYGVTHPSQIKKNKIRATEKSQEFFSSLCNSVEIDSISDPIVTNKIINFTCTKCNKSDSLASETFKWRCRKLSSACQDCSGISTGSAPQLHITEYIKSLTNKNVMVNDRKTLPSNRELDIFIPEMKLAIEVNGVYWHSENNIECDTQYRKYHLEKTEECNKHGIRLIHIFEDDWILKKDIIKGRLKSLFNPDKIYARKCDLVKITTTEEKNFLNRNHIQGYLSSSVKFGLKSNDELVAIMSFKKSRFEKKTQDYELLRYCSKCGIVVIGGASKLLKAFRKEMPDYRLSSYSDRTWGDGALYDKLGFKWVSNSAPSYRWIRGLESKSRYETQKHKLKLLLPIFDPKLSEAQNMFNNKWRRIWDCGTTKWILSPGAQMPG